MKRYFSIVILFLWFTESLNGQPIVSPIHPLVYTDTALRNEVLQWSKSIAIPNTLFVTHPSSINFPGAIKSGFKIESLTFRLVHKQTDAAQSKMFKKFVFSNPNARTLYSTGLYAAPGQAISITRPAIPSNTKIYLVVGSHSDYLGQYGAENEDWRRMPTVSTAFLLDSTFHYASSPFGGLVYLAITPDEPSIDVEITFDNIISAPYFKSGITTTEIWKEQLKNNKAPWGELASDKVIITLPDSTLQRIEDPEALLRLWNKILATEFELSQLPYPFVRPMRMVLDEQISAGSMHAGYPIMIMNSPSTNHFSEAIIINPNKLLIPSDGGANWGFFHEIGHNLQNYEMVFDGTAEVGCNFYSLYVFDELLKTRKGAHFAVSDSSQRKLMRKFFGEGATYQVYQQDPFLGLIPFMQLQKQFGWDTFKKVFRWYLDYRSYDYEMGEGDDTQKANHFKITRLVERFSVITRRNLVPFFKAWGIPIDKSLEGRLAGFKIWFPKELKGYVRNNKMNPIP